MLTYSALLNSAPTDMSSKQAKSVGFYDVKTMRFNEQQRKIQLKLADAYVREAYGLLWDQHNHKEAINVLEKALPIQRLYLGKQHKDVGWTCSFIGTTYWKSGDDRESLKYLLEARLIFCKAGKGNLIGVDQTICCILLKAGLDENEIDNYQTAVESTIKHEIQGDYYKKMGDLTEAKEEYRRARAVSKSLMDIFVLDA